jgi:processive 1,2-diacylglycerol beta-glucosyltransferase
MISRLLVVSASAGAGHVTAARALEKTLAARHPQIEVRHIDILDLTSEAFRKVYAQGYLTMANRLPALWGYFYEQMDHPEIGRKKAKLVALFDRLNYRRFFELVDEFRPDRIAATHFLPAALQGASTPPLSLAVTDFDVHAYWVSDRVARYFVASDEVAFRLHARGVARERIEVTGIPIDPAFGRAVDAARVRGELGLSEHTFTVLVTSGGHGRKDVSHTVQAVAATGAPLQIVAVCGRNERAHESVRRLAVPDGVRVIPLGFVHNMHELMAVTDVAVTKSGGLTVSECLARALPMIVFSPIPGQEERNCDYLLEQGAALKAVDLDALRFKLQRVRAERALLQAMRERARAIARPAAAEAVADRLAEG